MIADFSLPPDPHVDWLRQELDAILNGLIATVNEQIELALLTAATAAQVSVPELALRYHLGSSISMNAEGSAFTLSLWLEPRVDGPGELPNPEQAD